MSVSVTFDELLAAGDRFCSYIRPTLLIQRDDVSAAAQSWLIIASASPSSSVASRN